MKNRMLSKRVYFTVSSLMMLVLFMFQFSGIIIKKYNNFDENKYAVSEKNDLNKNQDRRALYERWQEVGDIVHFKDIASAETTPMSSRFVQEENVLTLESIYVGYEFYDGWIKKLGLSSLKIQASMRDVFRASTIRSERGIAYPFARSMEAGLSFNF